MLNAHGSLLELTLGIAIPGPRRDVVCHPGMLNVHRYVDSGPTPRAVSF
jgi:hypothetical protein